MSKKSKLKNEIRKELDRIDVPYKENYDVTIEFQGKKTKTDSKTIEEVAEGLKKGEIKLAKEEKQEFLFDEDNLILNALSTEKTEIVSEIKTTQKSIENKEKKLENLEERRERLESAIQAAKKITKEKEKK